MKCSMCGDEVDKLFTSDKICYLCFDEQSLDLYEDDEEPRHGKQKFDDE